MFKGKANLDIVAELHVQGFQDASRAFGATTYISMTSQIEEMRRRACPVVYDHKPVYIGNNNKTRYYWFYLKVTLVILNHLIYFLNSIFYFLNVNEVNQWV